MLFESPLERARLVASKPPPPSPAIPKRYSVSKKRRDTSDQDEACGTEVIRDALLKAAQLVQRNRELANEISDLRRGNQHKLRRINSLTRDLLSLRLNTAMPSQSVSTQTSAFECLTGFTSLRDALDDTTTAETMPPTDEGSDVSLAAPEVTADELTLHLNSRPRRHNARRMSYAEPSLKTKMRRPY